MRPFDKSAITLSLKFAFLISHADVSENRLPETKNNFSDYDISQPTPSASLSVPSCSLGDRYFPRKDSQINMTKVTNMGVAPANFTS